MGRIAEQLLAVRAEIDEACTAAGRAPDEVRLLPISKTHGPDVLREAYAAGVRLFGENKVQETQAKVEALADLADATWAMVGHLQSNKARDVAAYASEFHALDSLKIARALDRVLEGTGRTLDVFVQVNSSEEPQKYGFAIDEVEGVAADIRDLANLRVRGLMTLAVFSDDPDAVAACFRRTRELQRRLHEQDPGAWAELSMGMSGDFASAIAHGATTVRVGQAIFGPRE